MSIHPQGPIRGVPVLGIFGREPKVFPAFVSFLGLLYLLLVAAAFVLELLSQILSRHAATRQGKPQQQEKTQEFAEGVMSHDQRPPHDCSLLTAIIGCIRGSSVFPLPQWGIGLG